METTDQDIEEALDIAGTRLTVNAVRNWHETDGLAGLYFQHARTIAKLRIATEALEHISRTDRVRHWTATKENPETHWEIMPGYYARTADEALTQIKEPRP